MWPDRVFKWASIRSRHSQVQPHGSQGRARHIEHYDIATASVYVHTKDDARHDPTSGVSTRWNGLTPDQQLSPFSLGLRGHRLR